MEVKLSAKVFLIHGSVPFSPPYLLMQMVLENPQMTLSEFEGFMAKQLQHKPQSNRKKLNESEAGCVVCHLSARKTSEIKILLWRQIGIT